MLHLLPSPLAFFIFFDGCKATGVASTKRRAFATAGDFFAGPGAGDLGRAGDLDFFRFTVANAEGRGPGHLFLWR